MTRIAIIGCGIIGATIAYELSQVPGLEITAIDRAYEPATGATQAALGVLMGIISQKVKGRAWRLRERTLRRYEILIPELEAIAECSIPYNRQGIVKLCFPGEDLEKWRTLCETRRSQGWSLELLTPEQVRSRYEQLADLDLIGAVYSPQDRQLDPVALTRALVSAATRQGVAFQFGVEVLGARYTETGDRKICQELETSQGSLAVDWAIVAAGLGSTALTEQLGEAVEIRPVLGQGLKVRLATPLAAGRPEPVLTGDDVHIVPLGRGEYWIGATVEFPQAGMELRGDRAQLEAVWERAIAFCPGLANGEIVNTWSGLRPRPEGRPAPVIGPLDGFKNVLLATGHYRNGILLAPATALAVRETIAENEC
ncbi:NAD(P)/FAD-dependent oxidoreductase [Oxynema aestuarii]|jgi:glycine oxidase|uniref:FAD-binding oxidoreductase n=1 Tax=Oxynema aestuarii AP17 TaxID=2064643 RepID=A0A6H1TY02_9CYAN|nr:FAD-dependent oxidoreductase [Oxynema aestuarii]QIZ71096.1 FAD-binding oxidoreductase [Oxynema aestuarii AP17]RMH76891.1 MAG: FAD-binding oxidoreductase [Cyanobacteria bacterium J007]